MLPPHLREFDDTEKTRQLLYENTLTALKSKFPAETNEYRLELNDIVLQQPKNVDLSKQKQILMTNRYLRVPVVGTWRLVHKPTNTVLGEKRSVVLDVPYYTERGTIIYGGNEYTVTNQARLRPGVYVRKRRTGESEAQFNVKYGSGPGFRMRLEPETGVLTVAFPKANVPLASVLKVLGTDDKELIKTIGSELASVNLSKSSDKDIDRLYTYFAGRNANPSASEDEKRNFVTNSLVKLELDPEVVTRTLGLNPEYGKSINKQLLLRTAQKLLNVVKNEEQPDDRDALMFTEVYGIEDLLPERIEKDTGNLIKTLLFKAAYKRNLEHIGRGALNNYIYHPSKGLLFGSGLGMPLEETNPLHIIEQLNRITRLGTAGIGSAEAITMEARDVNNTQFGFIDPIAGPEGMNIGIDVRAAYKTFKGKDKKLYGEFTNVKTGKTEYLSPGDVYNSIVAFPGELSTNSPEVTALVNGKIVKVKRQDVTHEIPSLAHMFSSHFNFNPMPTAVQPARQFYGAKFWSQYMPLEKGEVPLVDSLTPDNKTTFTEYYGRKVGTISSKVKGTVIDADDNKVVVQSDDGKKEVINLVKYFPYNRISGISYFPKVKKGDRVNVGDTLAYSNFVDKDTGAINMGRNLKVAIMPLRGMNYEDAHVISESAAKKLANERLIGFDQINKGGIEIDKNKYLSVFPKMFSKDQYEAIGEDGVIKQGTIVKKGDPIILATGPKILTSADAQLGRLHKVLRQSFTDHAIIWDSDQPGVVVDAVRTPFAARVNVRSIAPVQVGDKLSTRFGLKGVVGAVLPDDKMPRDAATNEPYEIVLNPMCILSRVAPNQILEMCLGKLAKHTNQQIRLPQTPPQEGWREYVKKKLEEAKISDTTNVFDPETGKIIKGIGDGYIYVLPFHHIAEKKLSYRGESGAYTIDEQPAKGKIGEAKRYSQMDINATLAHGATEVVKDALLIRGAKNEEFWKALRLGRPLPEPKVPFIYNKFLNLLKAGGINIRDKGDILQLLPMTDDDVAALSKGKINQSTTVDYNFEPTAGGLFDVGKTGGLSGNFWTHVDLVEPMPNPVMEEPIRRLLGLTEKDLRSVLAGRTSLNGKTGGAALVDALKNINIDAMLEENIKRIKTARGSVRDNAVKIVGYLTSLKKQGLHPSKWMITKVPILPPIFRPLARSGDVIMAADLNELYRDLIEINNSISRLRTQLPPEKLQSEILNLYDAVTAAYGLGESITPEGRSKKLKGAIRQVIGENPKTGLFQYRVISKTVGDVGRGVITPDPNLGMDEIGLPEDAVWSIYKDFVIRRLVRSGYPVTRAIELIDKKAQVAKDALIEEMAARPVLVNRAPVWHKFNLMAFYPHIVKGTTIQVCPLVTKAFNADFDGDQMNFHVPISDKAVQQAKEKMLPSKNLISLTDLRSARYTPTMEMIMGLYLLTKDPSNKKPIRFKSIEEAKKAYQRGLITANDPIII